jgi:hypothetical protein
VGILLSAFLLYVLVSKFNDGIEDEILWKVLCIAGLTMALEFGLGYLGVPFLALVAVLGSTFLIGLLLVVWCNLSRIIAGKVAGSFLGIRLALSFIPLLIHRAA